MTATATVPPLETIAKGLVTRLPEGALAGAQRIRLVAALLGLGATAAGFFLDKAQFLHSYLVGYFFALSLCLGALFFVMVQHITRAGWSVVVRRIAENMAGVFPVMAVFFLPIAIFAPDLYHHWWPGHADTGDTTIQGKSGYLNPTFWYVRAAFYFVSWTALATWFRRTSLTQDQTGDAQLSLKMSRRAAPGLLVFALTLTFAAFDWLMSLNPHWFSTMFGVIVFAGCVVGTLATIAILGIWLGKLGYLQQVISAEHYHDLGKLLFAFTVFWSYTSFSQYMLIWYANLPEETEYYQMRLGTWEPVGIGLIVGHFILPFAFLMSRHIKRNRVTLTIGASFMLLMHFLDLHFMVLPNLYPATDGHGFHPSWMDATAVLGFFALFLSFTIGNIRKVPLLPERDPRLQESLRFHNI